MTAHNNKGLNATLHSGVAEVRICSPDGLKAGQMGGTSVRLKSLCPPLS